MNVCIYHANCIDGFGAATVAHAHFPQGSVKFHAGFYGEPHPDVRDCDVYLVDFSYKRDVIIQMLTQVRSLTIIDHHKSAIEDLADLQDPKLTLVTDLNLSGAVLAWTFFMGTKPVPEVLLHIQDRDLWHHKMPRTHEICAALYSHEFDFETWQRFYTPEGLQELYTDGIALVRARNKSIKQTLERLPSWTRIAGHKVPVLNCSPSIASEVTQGLYKMYQTPFAATYNDTNGRRVFSLRSDGTTDVAEIAFKLGGGGHRAAAGFSTPMPSIRVGSLFQRIGALLPW